MEPGTGFCPVATHFAFAFLSQAFAFPLHVTDLFCATYQVQFPHAKPRESQVYFTAYRDLSPVFESTTVGLVHGVSVGTGLSTLVFGALEVLATLLDFTGAAPGIMSFIPILSVAALDILFTLNISS